MKMDQDKTGREDVWRYDTKAAIAAQRLMLKSHDTVIKFPRNKKNIALPGSENPHGYEILLVNG